MLAFGCMRFTKKMVNQSGKSRSRDLEAIKLGVNYLIPLIFTVAAKKHGKDF